MAATVGTLQESSLHAALKAYYAQPGDHIEAQLDGYWVDIARGEQLIEIQTGNFSALKRKLTHFLPTHAVRVVLPLAEEKYILRVGVVDGERKEIARRKSPKRERVVDLFAEMVRIASLARLPGFSLEVVLVCEEEIWLDDGKGSWRRKGVSIVDRKLLAVLRSQVFTRPHDYLALLPAALPQPFTVRQLAAQVGGPHRLAGKMAYALREMGLLEVAGKRGNAILYTICKNSA